MRFADYERGSHHCLEHAIKNAAGVWRCSECLRQVPIRPTDNYQSLFDKETARTNEWLNLERRTMKIAHSRFAERAIYSSICPECERYIVRDASWIVELIHPHSNNELVHETTSSYHIIEGRYVHFSCYKAILRKRPCYYCGLTPASTIDHIKPRSKGGADEPYNMVAACESCNPSKGTRNQTIHILHKELQNAVIEEENAA